VKLLSDYLNICAHNPPELQTDRETDVTDRRHTIAIPRYARKCFARQNSQATEYASNCIKYCHIGPYCDKVCLG